MTHKPKNRTIRTLAVSIAIFSLMLLGCGGSDEPGDPKAGGNDTDQAAGKGGAVETFLSGLTAFNEANLEQLLEVYTFEATWDMPSSEAPLVRGRKAVARQIVAFKGLLPESTIGARRVLEGDGWIVIQAVVNGTHRWNAQGIARSPKKVGYEMIYFVRADDAGKADETIVYYDQTSLRRQLGAMKGATPAVPVWPEQLERVGESGSEANVALVKQLLAVVEKGEFDGLDALVTDSFTLYDRASSRQYSLAQVKKRLGTERESFAAPRIEIGQVVSAGRYVALRFVQNSTYQGPDERADTEAGEPVTFHGAHVFEISGGKIAALETYANEMELIRQAKRLAAEKKAAEADAGVSSPPTAAPPGD
ncbi:MAG: ester cyclase [Deltaproteobacteria bacterium]|nr:ester cyclase [Deltaproteobacteria bacterium]